MESQQRILTEDYSEIIQRLPISLKLSYGIGHVLNDICASMWFTYLLVFFHLVLGFNSIIAGVILLVGQIADALATPFVGFYSDKTDEIWLCKYGRRKTWHLIGTLCVLFAFPFIFSHCIGCETAHEWAQVIYYIGFAIIFQFGWAAVQISHLSLVPELTPTEYERTELIAIRYSFTVLSNIFVYCVTWAVLHITNNKDSSSKIGPDDAKKFQEVVFIGIGTGIITSILFHIFVKENLVSNSNGSLRRNSRGILLLLKDIRLYQVAFIYMPTRLFVNLSQIYIPLYLHESLNMPATSLAIIPLIMFLSSFVMSLIVERLNTKLGRKISYCLGVMLGLFTCIWIQFGSGLTYTKYQIYPLFVILGSAGSIMVVTSLGITADFIGQNIGSSSFVYGIISFTDKLCNGLAVMLIQYLSCWTNCKSYYRGILVYVCGASIVFGVLMILCIKPFYQSMAYSTLHSEQTTGHDTTSVSTIENEPDNSLQQENVT
ncbi:Major facilitator superfamily domain-containing protein 12 [Habropoda laboriosa]|uniref:Major facilitator superfamily domain-containing protein 12 n=1 Tax=Habropoda laboriosa TaxID=597456 RepID=A0A0L7RBV1_9HYME|nr:PREDICTED: major facilitator superfamily domain-containing protein 12-like [Habropoda laboriosa]KOC68329.1 Major facilitator superfamily domain-containing protein 12 [Habropoda laboriosa]